jgi:hypothetical protein
MQIGEMTLAGQPASIEAARKRVLIMQAGQSGGGCSGSGGAADHGRPSRGDRKTPDRTRVCAEQVLRSFNTWAFKREQPSDLPLMLEVIARAISRSEPLHFVLYWGKGPRCDIAEWDLQCLSFLALFLARVAHVYQPGAALNLVFTDTHARLNGHSRASMNKYFLAVTLAAGQRGSKPAGSAPSLAILPSHRCELPQTSLFPRPCCQG